MTTLARPISDQLPNLDDTESMKREDRRSARKLAKWLRDQYDKALTMRQSRVNKWVQVEAIMAGVHYYKWENGVLQRMPPSRDPRKIRAVDPLMKPYYRWEHGRMASNRWSCYVKPRVGQGQDEFFQAKQGQAVMLHWIEEERLDGWIKDTVHQHMIYYGGSYFYAYRDEEKQTVKIKPVPCTQVLPIPWDAKNHDEAAGLMRVQFASTEWLEAQDEKTARMMRGQGGPAQFRRMAEKKGTHDMRMSLSGIRTSSEGGAWIITAWLKPHELNPNGEYLFMVEDELFRYKGNPGPNGEPVLPGGHIPLIPIDYLRRPDSFWPEGFLEGLIYAQLEANRQMNIVIQSALRNKPYTFFDSSVIDSKDMAAEDSGLVPLRRGFEGSRIPALHFPAASLNRDVGTVLSIAHQSARRNAGYESSIIFGQSEGRVEGGPATAMLNANAQTPLASTVAREFQALKELYGMVAPQLAELWPQEKQFTLTGPLDYARTWMVRRQDLTSMGGMLFTPTPIVAGGFNSQLQMLFGLRQMQSPDGGFELSSREFRRALQNLDALPQGIQVVSDEEQRIKSRIALLLNDYKTPGIPPAGAGNPAIDGPQAIENHRLAVDLLKEVILDPAFRMYGPGVRAALLKEIQFHHEKTYGAMEHPDAFDDDILAADSRVMEEALAQAEDDIESVEGTLNLNGVPV